MGLHRPVELFSPVTCGRSICQNFGSGYYHDPKKFFRPIAQMFLKMCFYFGFDARWKEAYAYQNLEVAYHGSIVFRASLIAMRHLPRVQAAVLETHHSFLKNGSH